MEISTPLYSPSSTVPREAGRSAVMLAMGFSANTVSLLALVLAMDAPVLMHVVTKKGAGYEPALRDPERFHGVGPFDIRTGASTAAPSSAEAPRWGLASSCRTSRASTAG